MCSLGPGTMSIDMFPEAGIVSIDMFPEAGIVSINMFPKTRTVSNQYVSIAWISTLLLSFLTLKHQSSL